MNKQYCVHNRRIPQFTKMRIFVFIINNSSDEQKSPTCSYVNESRLNKRQFMKTIIYIGHISENATLMRFFVMLLDIPNL